MTRKLLLGKICLSDCTYNCVILDSCDCDYCEVKLNKLLDEYDKHVIEQYKANTGLNDTIRDIHDNVSREMYCKGIDDFMEALITMYERYDIDAVFESSDTYSYTNACCIFEDYIKEIAEELKAGGKNEN